MRKLTSILVVLILLSSLAVFLFAQEKKEEQKSMTVTGTLVDLSCYAKMGALTNDHGSMENCGTMCARGGLPVAIVDKDKKVHFLAVPAPAYADYVGEELRLTGMAGKNAAVFIPKKFELKEDGKWVEKKLPKTMM